MSLAELTGNSLEHEGATEIKIQEAGDALTSLTANVQQFTCLEVGSPCMALAWCRTLGLVQVIDLQGNHLNALPSLPASLHAISVSRNLFRKFPETLCSLPSLTDLDLGRNQLQSVPPAISQLQSLKILNLMNNHLESLPSEIGSLPSLYRLGLKSNKLTELPENIGNLHSLVGGSTAPWQGVFAMCVASTSWWQHQQ